MNNREAWIDYAKGLGIILVVFGHVIGGLINAPVDFDRQAYALVISFIYTFHMPLFFFLSGIFLCRSLSKRGTLNFLLNKVDTIVYPYLIWSLIQGGMLLVMSNFMHSYADNSLNRLLSILWRPIDQFWFLFALFLITAVCVAYFSILKNQSRWLLLSGAVVAYLVQPGLPNIPALNFIAKYAVFFVLGVIFSEYQNFALKHVKSLLLPTTFLFLLTQYFYHIYMGFSYPAGGALLLSTSVISLCFVILICMLLARYSITWLTLLGISSMTIYLQHTIIGAAVRVFLLKGLLIEYFAVHVFFGFLLALLMPMLIEKVFIKCKMEWLLRVPDVFSTERQYQTKNERH